MYYDHESPRYERKQNAKPMCTSLPRESLVQSDVELCEEYLKFRGIPQDLAKLNGWYPSAEAGDNYTRIVIPAITHKAGHVYWQARDVTGKAFLRYQSPSGPRHEALVRTMPSSGTLKGTVIVEGPFDALAASSAGYIGIALMGIRPSKATLFHLGLLLVDYDTPVLVLLDRDAQAEALLVSVFLASQGIHATSFTLPGPEKDLAQCQPARRKHLLKRGFNL